MLKQVAMSMLAKQIRGVSYKPTDLHDTLDSESVILLRANNIGDGLINFDDVVYVDKSKVSSEQYLRKGDILICASSGSKTLVGKAAQIQFDGEYTFGAFCKVVRPIQISPDFLGMYFQSPSYRCLISNLAQGANINNIKNEHIDTLLVNTYDESTQNKFTSILNKVVSIIRARRQQLTELDTLVKARFVEMFGGIHDSRLYPYIAVKGITEVVSGGTPSREIANYWDNGTIPWVKTTELQNKVITSTEEYITDDGLNNSSAKIVPKGTILIAMYGQGKTRGMTAYLGIEACTNQACACILPTEKINQIYLWQYFVLSYDKLRDMAKGGNQPNLNGNIIKNFPILYPPIRLQNQFAAFVTQVNQTKAIVQKALEEAQTLFDSLMQQYFG